MNNILYFRTYRSYGHFPYKIVDHVTRSILLCPESEYGKCKHLALFLLSGDVILLLALGINQTSTGMLSIILLTKPVIVLIMLCSLLLSNGVLVTKQECGVDFSCSLLLSNGYQTRWSAPKQPATYHPLSGWHRWAQENWILI